MLFTYYLKIKQMGKLDPTIEWEILSTESVFSGKGSRCNLCISGKLAILQGTSDVKKKMLNKRQKLTTTCRHEQFPD